MALWDAGGPGVGGPHGIVECWRAQGGRTPVHCGMMEDLGWEDPKALWDAGGPGMGGPQCIVG